MIKRIKSSMFAKVFLITLAMLLCVSLLVFGLLAWFMPQTYSNRLNTVLDKRSQDFISELEQVAFSDSGALFDQFIADMKINSVELYNSDGDWVPLPTKEFDNEWGVNIAQTTETGLGKTTPILSNSYYFSFSDRSDHYMLIVYGEAEQLAELQQSFTRIFPFILLIILVVALIVSWLYSRIITKPVLEISNLSKKMSNLQLDWEIDIRRTDELGILENSLNTLSHNLSNALSELQSANKKLEADIEHEKKLERAQLDFFSAVSHELKTPITVIKGQLEGMLLGIGTYKDHDKYLSRSLEITNTLETMVQEILTVSRLETANESFKKEKIDCVRIIRHYLDSMEDLIIKKELQIDCDMPHTAYINGNEMLIEKVFSNLIGNAIIYSPQGASISIAIHAMQNNFTFCIENTGIHIPEECIPKLFEAFYRVEQSRSRKTGGSGLGLYITQKILHQHGSKCDVRNTQAGVQFFFII